MEKAKAKAKNPPAQPEQPSPEDTAERVERLQKLLMGRVRSENPVVDYMVGQLRMVLKETEQLSNQLQQTEARAAQMRNRLIELRGIRAKYTEDIQVFDKPDGEQSEADPKTMQKAVAETQEALEAATEPGETVEANKAEAAA